MSMHALLIGKRAKILDDVANRLRAMGWTVTLTSDLAMQKLQAIDVSRVSVVAFGRALTSEEKHTLAAYYKTQNPLLTIVNGWAPIPELIAGQIRAAAQSIPGLVVQRAKLTVDGPTHLHIKAFRLNWLYQLKTKELDVTLTKKEPVDLSAIAGKFRYFVLETNDGSCSVVDLRA